MAVDWSSIAIGAIVGGILSVPFGLYGARLHETIFRPRASISVGEPTGQIKRSRSRRGRLRRLFRQSIGEEVYICTDGGFMDTAAFFLAVEFAQPDLPEIQISYRQIDWGEIPFRISEKGSNIVAYLNRRNIPRVTTDIKIWSNLGAFHGHALIGRKKDFPGLFDTLDAVNATLEEFAQKGPIKILCCGGESSETLQTPLVPILRPPHVVFDSRSAPNAYQAFVRGEGDLLLATLPQRLACKRSPDFVEIMSSENNPLFFGIDVLVYTPDIKPEIVEAISIGWSRLCRRLAADEGFCREQYRRWTSISEALNISSDQFTEDDFVLAMHSQVGTYLRPFSGRDDAAEELISASKACFALAAGNPEFDTAAALETLYEHYTGRVVELT